MYSKTLMLIFLIIFCFRKNGSIAKRCKGLGGKSYCCDNHEEISGTCIACNDGFFSVEGEPCHPCPKGFFGSKCIHPCRCSSTHRCDNVQGCIYLEQSTTQMYKESTVLSPPLVDRKTENDATLLGPSKTDIGVLTYSICTGGITCILLFLLGIYRYTRRRNRQHRVVLANNILQNNAPLPAEHNEYIEEVYAMIDESKMLDDPL